MMLSADEINTRFEDLLRSEGYQVQPWQLQSVHLPGRVAESAYFAIVFQPFELWAELTGSLQEAELEIESSMRPGSGKVWDAYLLLACQEGLTSRQQFDDLVRIQYDTRRMRKLVMPGVGNSLSSIDELVRPFMQLQKIAATSKTRDPLAALQEKLLATTNDAELIKRAMVLFRDAGSLDAL